MIHGMACQDVTIGHTCFPRKGSLRLTNTAVGGGGRGGGDWCWCVFMMELVLLKGGDNTSSHHLCLTIKGCPGKLEVGRLDAQR